jgi:oxygen-independent coproporphyrinogen-3 oxidase
VAAWAEAIGRELELVRAERGWSEPLPLGTLYLGGGTPSLLGTGAMDRLLTALGPGVDRTGMAELTAEANPESFDARLADDWVRSGVNRVSFGAQTFHGPSLRWMGRLHGPDGPGRAVRAARAAGLDNVSVDLIFGLPERLERDLRADLDRVLELEPEHISVYGLSVEPDTPLGRWVAAGREEVPDQDRYQDEYLALARRLRDAGYRHYEVSNFALPGREAKHNAAYWQGAPYLGLGNGAHSFVAPERWWNPRSWDEYRDRVARGRIPRDGSERLTAREERLERLWLGLRTAEGLERGRLSPAEAEAARDWVSRGWAVKDELRLRLTPEGWLLLDRLAVELDAAVAEVA